MDNHTTVVVITEENYEETENITQYQEFVKVEEACLEDNDYILTEKNTSISTGNLPDLSESLLLDPCSSQINQICHLSSVKNTDKLSTESIEEITEISTEQNLEERLKTGNKWETLDFVGIQNDLNVPKTSEAVVGISTSETEDEVILFNVDDGSDTREKKIIGWTSDDPVTCDICQKVLTNKASFCQHSLTHKETQFVCDICKQKFQEEHLLKLHLKIHSEQKKHETCDQTLIPNKHKTIQSDTVCEETFDNKKSINLHNGKNIETNCSKRKLLFKYKCLEDKNTESVHSKVQMICGLCGQIYKNTTCLKAHKKRCHLNKTEYQCEHCEKVFRDKSTLKRHVRIHTNERNYVCEICGAKFVQNSTMHAHRRTHTDSKPFECEICQKTFQRKSNLQVHLQTHGTVEAYKCLKCDRTFKTAASLYHHKSIHEQREFVCYCGSSFVTSKSLNKHMQNKHRNDGKVEKLEVVYVSTDIEKVTEEL